MSTEEETKPREVLPLPRELKIHVLQEIITRNNTEECRLIEESRRCRDELLSMGAEAYPPFLNQDVKEKCTHSHWHLEGNESVCDFCGDRKLYDEDE